MSPPVLEKLLILQDRDAKRLSLEAQLKSIPKEIDAVNMRITSERAAIESAKTEVRELETKKKSLENDIGSAEEKVGKYKNQQLQVRKNDEYQALTHEIATTQAAIGTFEEEELKVMYLLDEAKKRFVSAENILKENITGHETKIKNFREREQNVQTELKQQQEVVGGAREGVANAIVLKLYDRLAALAVSGKLRFPVCVPLHDQKCGGCHLKISAGVETDVRKGENVTTCDQCGRILYWQP